MTFSKFDVFSDYLFKKLNILPLDKLVFHRIGHMMHTYVNGSLPPVMNDLYTLNSDIHDHYTRQSQLLHTKKGSINVFTKNFANISPRVWNAIQNILDVNVSMYIFKNRLKMFLQANTLELIYPK